MLWLKRTGSLLIALIVIHGITLGKLKSQNADQKDIWRHKDTYDQFKLCSTSFERQLKGYIGQDYEDMLGFRQNVDTYVKSFEDENWPSVQRSFQEMTGYFLRLLEFPPLGYELDVASGQKRVLPVLFSVFYNIDEFSFSIDSQKCLAPITPQQLEDMLSKVRAEFLVMPGYALRKQTLSKPIGNWTRASTAGLSGVKLDFVSEDEANIMYFEMTLHDARTGQDRRIQLNDTNILRLLSRIGSVCAQVASTNKSSARAEQPQREQAQREQPRAQPQRGNVWNAIIGQIVAANRNSYNPYADWANYQPGGRFAPPVIPQTGPAGFDNTLGFNVYGADGSFYRARPNASGGYNVFGPNGQLLRMTPNTAGGYNVQGMSGTFYRTVPQ